MQLTLVSYMWICGKHDVNHTQLDVVVLYTVDLIPLIESHARPVCSPLRRRHPGVRLLPACRFPRYSADVSMQLPTG